MIAAVESVINQTEAAEETKNLIRQQVSSLLMTHKPREILPKVERDALRELKADKDIVIVPADKGRSTVVLDRTDYRQKAKNLLDDRQFYVPCETNPVKTLTREINATLLALENSGAITPTDRRMARAQETTLARFYGLSKVHKKGAPLRPIVSLKGTPTYGLAKWLFRRLKFLTADSDTTVCSSTQFLEKLKGVGLLPNEVIVSFDVTSLFTSILQNLAIETVEVLLRSKYNQTANRLGHAQVLQLLKFCLKTYFTFDGTIYEQVKGIPMGSPISGFIAEAVLQRLESLVFQYHRPKFWARQGVYGASQKLTRGRSVVFASATKNRRLYDIIRSKASVESWRGIILASVVILVILGLITISIFIVTPKKYLRKYNSISLEAIVQLTQGAISDGLIWSDDENYYWFYTSEGLWKIFPGGDFTSAAQTPIRSIFLFTFSSRKDLYVSGVSLSPDKSTWLIEYDVEHGSTNGGGKSYEAVVLGQSNNFDVERFDLTFLLDERQALASHIRWANRGTEMVAAIEGNLYFSERLSTNTHNFGFVCLTCNLTNSYAYGQIHPQCLAMYDYGIADVYWMSPVNPTKIIFLAFQKDLAVEGKMAQDIGKLSEVRNIGLVVLDTQYLPAAADLNNSPFATENLTVVWVNEILSGRSPHDRCFYVTKAAWFDHQTFLLMCTSGDRRYLWVLRCRLSHEGDLQKLCQRIWHFRSTNGILRKPQNYDLRRSGQGSVYAILPHSGGSYTQYRLANLQISPSRLQWISPRDYDVHTLEFISDEMIIFTSEYKVEGSRHLLR
ncbi:hypothetical protein SprV_0902712100 [Sparganum proliferum]